MRLNQSHFPITTLLMNHLTSLQRANPYSNDESSDSPMTPNSLRSFLNSDDEGQWKIFNEPIHDHFRLSPVSCAVIDTRPFQRLRGLKQLGCCEYVYPGATHTRFEHSLGVGYLAGVWSRTLLEDWRGPHEYRKRYSEIVEVAGLCHDLGHGPFSHAWEHRILPSLGVPHWKHEDMSVKLVDIVFEEAGIEDRFEWTPSDREIVKDLILGNKDACNSLGFGEFPRFLFDIVNNRSNGFDVDKFDYLPRDSFHTNVKISAPYSRLLHFAKADDDRICYRLSVENDLRQVYMDRGNLHRKVYCHKISRAVELMIADALKEVGSDWRLQEMSQFSEEFLKLDDSFIKFVRDWSCPPSDKGRRAEHILDRINRRKLYTLCGEVRVPTHMIEEIKDRVSEQDIVNHQTCNKMNLHPNDIHVTTVYIDRGFRNQDPIDQTTFYSGRFYERCQTEEVVETCHQLWVRVYCKDDAHEMETRDAFKSWEKSTIGRQEGVQTPEKINPRIHTDDTMMD